MDNNFKCDYMRSTNDSEFNVIHFIKDYVFYHRIRYMYHFRKAARGSLYSKVKLYLYSRKYGIEIKASTKIGKAFVMIHPYNITVSPYAVIGENVTMMKGSTVGLGKGGAPTVGNKVYIGINSTVIGKINVGNDVLIAPNTMVNVDVPDHSVVIGNPCKIIHKDNATQDYIWKIY